METYDFENGTVYVFETDLNGIRHVKIAYKDGEAVYRELTPDQFEELLEAHHAIEKQNPWATARMTAMVLFTVAFAFFAIEAIVTVLSEVTL